MKLWLDVDDLFFFAERSVRPTGIQRLTGELYSALEVEAGGKLGFLRHDREGRLRLTNWSEVQSIYRRMTSGAPQARDANAVQQSVAAPSLLDRILRLIGLQASPGADGIDKAAKEVEAAAPSFESLAQAGDVLCCLGAPWHHPSYAQMVKETVVARGVRVTLLVHDLIPLLCRQYFELGRAPHFDNYMRDMLPLADFVFTNSRSTARDVGRWAARAGLTLKTSPIPIPVGTGFSRPPAGALPPGLAADFVLFVSTIEVRKNHTQAFRIWTRLLDELPYDQVPTLVFVGSIGWMVDDLMKAIEATGRLDGKLVLLHDVDDATLSALYQACRFTLFTSFYEGWGLPVSDSLAFGKVCVASNKTSIPEAGGSYCFYVDPDNTAEAYGVVRKLVEDPEVLRTMENKLHSEFKPVPWSSSARAILRHLSPREAKAPPA
jgi:glycosyltransferase involved in cell wall biosynthesis